MFWWVRGGTSIVSCSAVLKTCSTAQPGGYPGFAGGDGLAVAAAVGAFGQVGAVLFDFADVGFALISVRSEGKHNGTGCSVQDHGDGPGFEVPAGQGGERRAVGLGPGLPRRLAAVPGTGRAARRA